MELEASFEPRAIRLADLVGYSRWLAPQPVATYAVFTSHLRRVLEPVVQRHAGTIVKTTDEGIVAMFEDARAAENAARDIQRSITEGDVALCSDFNLRTGLPCITATS